MAFQLIAGHPALDLVNTLDWRFGTKELEEKLIHYDDLLRFAEESKLLAAPETRQLRGAVSATSAAQALKRCKELREALAEIFYAQLDGGKPPAAARSTAGRYFAAARQRQTLDWKQCPQLQWQWEDRENDPLLPVWTLALSAADLMTSEAIHRVRDCGDPECRWLFLDTSKNHTRRWCDMKICGNRMKARRFKAQRNH